MARPQLEAALRRDPQDEHAWSVFGDLLAAEGDSRGELIALEQRAAVSERPFTPPAFFEAEEETEAAHLRHDRTSE